MLAFFSTCLASGPVFYGQWFWFVLRFGSRLKL